MNKVSKEEEDEEVWWLNINSLLLLAFYLSYSSYHSLTLQSLHRHLLLEVLINRRILLLPFSFPFFSFHLNLDQVLIHICRAPTEIIIDVSLQFLEIWLNFFFNFFFFLFSFLKWKIFVVVEFFFTFVYLWVSVSFHHFERRKVFGKFPVFPVVCMLFEIVSLNFVYFSFYCFKPLFFFFHLFIFFPFWLFNYIWKQLLLFLFNPFSSVL